MTYQTDLAVLRERLSAEALTVVSRQFARQRREVADRAAAGATRLGKAISGVRGEAAKQVLTVWSPEQLVPEWHAARLRRAFANVYARAMREGYGLSTLAFGLRVRLTNEDVRAFVAEAGERLTGVTDTTRRAVREALREGLLARDTPDQLATRLRGLPEFSRERAATVARTEVAEATNRAAQTAYARDGRVVGVRIHDRERCAPAGGPCAGWDGRRLTVAEAGATPMTMHPNCSQMRSPILL